MAETQKQANPIKLYNTIKRQKEEFKSRKSKVVNMYSCGPTVYNYAHIGNLRSYVNVDILRRTLEHSGYKVNQVMNITDVGHLTSDADTGEDKVEKKAKEEGKSAWDITKFYKSAFLADIAKLNIEEPKTVAKATDYIPEQIEFIRGLEKKGYTYQIDDGVYFDTSKLKDYGNLARLKSAKLKPGARVRMVEGKKNITDFALWKLSGKGGKRQMEWDSPWGKGFPGWHLECSVISRKFLGDVFDIHTGGTDHIPIHHTNEIAQSEALTGKIPAHYWFHTEFLMVEGRKMSKSLSNIYTLDEMAKKFNVEPLAFRTLCLMSHYRDKLNFTHSNIIDAQNTLDNLREFVLKINVIAKSDGKIGNKSRFDKLVKNTRQKFEEAINDDLSMPKAMAILFKFIKEFHREKEYLVRDAVTIKEFIDDIEKVLGLGLTDIKVEKIPESIQELAVDREDARKAGDFVKADKMRVKIEKSGYEIEDTIDGPIVRKH